MKGTVMSNIQTFAAPAGRVLIAIIFVMAGVNKISGYAGTQGYMESMGVPGILLPVVIILEIAGGLAIAVGWRTRWAAAALAVFTILSAIIFHFDPADQMQFTSFLKNLAIAGGFLFLVAHGPGAFALDNRAASGGVTE